jgi:hypothetical protein
VCGIVTQIDGYLIRKPFGEAELLTTLGQIIAGATPHDAP